MFVFHLNVCTYEYVHNERNIKTDRIKKYICTHWYTGKQQQMPAKHLCNYSNKISNKQTNKT